MKLWILEHGLENSEEMDVIGVFDSRVAASESVFVPVEWFATVWEYLELDASGLDWDDRFEMNWGRDAEGHAWLMYPVDLNVPDFEGIKFLYEPWPNQVASD